MWCGEWDMERRRVRGNENGMFGGSWVVEGWGNFGCSWGLKLWGGWVLGKKKSFGLLLCDGGSG